MATVAIFGQRTFGAAVADALAKAGHRIEFVSSPRDRPDGMLPDPLRRWADDTWTDWHDAAQHLDPNRVPEVDVIVAAHSHQIIGRRTRARAKVAVGYHPSLLPIHRGRDAVRWTIHMRDRVTGGTVYHLTDRTDGGPIAAQRHLLVNPDDTTSTLWARLFTLGLDLLTSVCDDVDAGMVGYTPQDETCATWEPSWERPRLHKPELPEIAAPGGIEFVAGHHHR